MTLTTVCRFGFFYVIPLTTPQVLDGSGWGGGQTWTRTLDAADRVRPRTLTQRYDKMKESVRDT